MSTPDKVGAAPTGTDEVTPATEKQKQVKEDDDVFFVELPAPAGWQKKFIPKNSGTPKKNEIIFISPTGEEIRNKRQLGQFLKSHPGGPPSSEFDWGTGETPRRSSRISEKAKATETPEGELPKKRGRTSSSKKKSAEKKDVQGEEEGASEEESSPAVKEMKEDVDSEMKDSAPEVETSLAETEIADTDMKDGALEDERSAAGKENKQTCDVDTEETKEAEMKETEKTNGDNDQPTTDETVAKEDHVSIQENITEKDAKFDDNGNVVPITGEDGGQDESAEAKIEEQKAAVEEKSKHQQMEEVKEEKVEDKEEKKDGVGEDTSATEVLPSLEVGMASAEENMEQKEGNDNVGENPSATEVLPPSTAEMTSVDNGSHEDSQDHNDVHPKDRDEMPAQPKASPIQC